MFHRRALPGLLLTALPLAAAAQQSSSGGGRTTQPAQADGAASPPRLAGASERALHRRAVEAVIWGMPAVNTDLMLQAGLQAGGRPNEVIYWSRPVDWRNQTLTPNPDALYFMIFFDTRDAGPLVIDVPPADTGSFAANIDDVWQTPLEDAGPFGADAGRGGKYLILPPGHPDAPPQGYIVLRPDANTGYALFRADLPGRADADIARAADYGRRLKVHPLSQAASPPPTRFTDAFGTMYDATIPYDIRFFRALDRVVQREPWLQRDRAMIDPLRSIGIRKGGRFEPDAATQAILEAAAREAHEWLDQRVEAGLAPRYFDGAHWFVPAAPELLQAQPNNYADPDTYPTDARAAVYSIGYIGIKRFGTAQFYLLTTKDKDGRALDGGRSYRLRVPADAPVQQYWSATVYDRATHALIRDMPRGSRASQDAALPRNADGSVDIVFGPAVPAGQEANWIPTRAGGGFEVIFRLYGPTRPLFEKTWTLPDIEPMAGRATP
ncbi:DUF1214 domain-containing protein [Falsiroseomonas sp. HW251]|uniref:DUF1214 domain-containing protein n=1 Tax=Falsiroseomonas sp. HW251 TaxID=3390998 RepID=UPI003D3139E2